MPKKKLDIAGSLCEASDPLVIRKVRFGEGFATTRNAVCYNCVRVRETASFSPDAVSTRYHRLKGPPVEALSTYSSLVVFHEVYTMEGNYFAHPQMLSPDPFMPDDLQLWEAEAFTFELSEWVMITREESEDGGFEYHSYPIGWPAGPYQTTLEEFQRELDFALAPYVIDSLEHPLVHQLLAESGIAECDAIWRGHAPME